MKIFGFSLQRFGAIANSATNTIITATDETNSVNNSGNIVQLYLGDGADTVYNKGNLVTISAGEGNNSISNSGDNVIITAGDGNDSVTNSSDADSVSIALGDGNNYVRNGGNDVTIVGGDNQDKIYDNGDRVLISLGAGDDSVDNRYGNNLTILGGEGNDTIYNFGNATKIFGGTGNEYIYNRSDDTSIEGGKGNDKVELSSKNTFITYTYGDGSDTIYGFNADDTLQINTSVDFSTMRSGDDLYITFDNGSITLAKVDAAVGSSNFIICGLPEAETITQEAEPTVDTTPVTSQPATTTTQQPTSTTSAGGNTTVTNTTTNTTNITNNNYYFGFPLASNMFGFFGGQSNTISKFITGRGSNANVLAFGTSLTSINRTSSYMSFNAADGSTLRVNNSSSVNEAIQYSTDGKNISLAKVGYAEKNNSFTYEDGVNFYSGGSHTDVLNVTNYQSRNIWLDGSAGVGYSGINNIDASTSTGNNTLAGDGGNNQITAGSGNDSLWGGSGSSEDVLIGGSGQNMFWYGKGDGNDQVQQSKTGDVINLYDVTLADITTAGFNGNAISVGFNTGFSLNVNVSSNLSSTFRLADGSNWKYNKSSGNWQSA